jgi:polyhydroxybutyrate depolymerase
MGGAGGGGPIGGTRPVKVFVPSKYDPKVAMPLVILLHGYSASGDIQESYMQFQPLAESRGFLYAHPDGEKDAQGYQFWNATEACCDFGSPKIDDSAYLEQVIHDIQGQYTVDPKRIFFIGHSNGGFMSYRMACDHSDTVAAIAVLAGDMFNDPMECKAQNPVSVLHIHGTADATIAYLGGTIGPNAFPAAATSVQDWVTTNGCDAMADTSAPNLDLEATIPGAESTVSTWKKGCKAGTGVAFWTVLGGSHVPNLSKDFSPNIIDFLLAHPKP